MVVQALILPLTTLIHASLHSTQALDAIAVGDHAQMLQIHVPAKQLLVSMVVQALILLLTMLIHAHSPLT
ncbi:MAG: hypothetical protein A2451_07410 [Bdellovibrionales bacterium RIFOXYC2_FULL_39_8]|nr:MAG: hypothetical protein A2385_14710 [Bdellovibrionales bacterium RIFOXYB1_FULL_39_21]OFZ43762.1 MAG: hypothetical protein A2485_04160 [Bdellovibrionales bacterium RIFOXYC12_FULL_39_17]OFZ47668.1 MAG: hypothetical protein A2404_09675 [Bdellovibrionales bacterium RIFOXYC1_FULL_39_130]OFZ73430.1 MAG: hypothetical protein A2451_07410 [Bdellovibrionales bacterium RIFOXYC2_FULL_39_8]OFZ76434.1 MAG: hypothetical protein A2560_17685 [Bdellovibrionales bacterium RIFOXYD1_FULL_39_84]